MSDGNAAMARFPPGLSAHWRSHAVEARPLRTPRAHHAYVFAPDALQSAAWPLPAGLVMNSMKGATGQGGTFMGSVVFAGDFYDSTTSELVESVATRQEPNAMDVTAALSELQAARVGITQGAEKLLAAINKMHGK